MKNSSARKSLHQFSEALYVKYNTSACRLCAAQSMCKVIRTGNVLWSNIINICGYTKINQKVIESLYNGIIHHHQVLKSLIANDFIDVYINWNSKKINSQDVIVNFCTRTL